MRPGQNKRMRGRNNNNNNNNNGGNRKGPNPLTRSYESNGPDVKIRGNAHHVAEKYLQLARDAQLSGDPVGAESYLQHAEHYFRLIASYQQTQMGIQRQPDDTDNDDGEESGIPDRFASPQAPVPFAPQQQPQPYAGDRPQPVYNPERSQNGERQPYQDRPYNGERQGQDRNGYDRSQQRPDRNGQQRRPFRDEARNGEFRAGDDRRNDRRNGYDRGQERAQQQERFGNERSYRDLQPEQPGDVVSGEQPRSEVPDIRPDPQGVRTEPMVRAEAMPRRDAVPRGEPPLRAEIAARPTVDDEPNLPSFITTPTRIIAAELPAAPLEADPAAVTAFPGDDAAEAPKFPRRRRRTTRATTADDTELPADPSAGD